jgi:hypothetical protein
VRLPDEWLTLPAARAGEDDIAEFDRLLDAIDGKQGITPIDYRLAAPKWLFLQHAVDTGRFVLHGTADGGITEFVPRQSNDTREFGRRAAIYAATDGIWPLFYATIDRRKAGTIVNAAADVTRTAGPVGDVVRTWFFSMDAVGLADSPWQAGTVYLLPAATFEADAGFAAGEFTVTLRQSASAVSVTPAATLGVGPDDFPFRDRVRGHREELLRAAMAADPSGFPWPQACAPVS